jgi:HAD superfamily hydrolase (TIGR01509 family)
MSRTLARILAASNALLIDFDGPLCSIFSNYKNTEISTALRSILGKLDVRMPDHVVQEWDPLEILRWSATLDDPSIIRAVEDGLRNAELRAARTATPTPGSFEVLTAACERGLSISIVSNNSAPAIVEYLDVHDLTEYDECIVGRTRYRPDLMKPNPRSLLIALRGLGIRPSESVFIGDSLTDITAAKAAGVPVIGFANAVPKLAAFAEAGADVVVTSMTDVAAGLRLGP